VPRLIFFFPVHMELCCVGVERVRLESSEWCLWGGRSPDQCNRLALALAADHNRLRRRSQTSKLKRAEIFVVLVPIKVSLVISETCGWLFLKCGFSRESKLQGVSSNSFFVETNTHYQFSIKTLLSKTNWLVLIQT